MELEQIEMASLIPQRPPFMMVDKILSCDDTGYRGEYGTVVCCQNGLCEPIAQQAYQVRLYRRD